jgi:hypothetical protein
VLESGERQLQYGDKQQPYGRELYGERHQKKRRKGSFFEEYLTSATERDGK